MRDYNRIRSCRNVEQRAVNVQKERGVAGEGLGHGVEMAPAPPAIKVAQNAAVLRFLLSLPGILTVRLPFCRIDSASD
jgi:hypothetical protein